MSNLNFDSTGIEPQQDFETLPPDTYTAAIIESSVAPNAKGTGTLLKLRLQVMEGQYQGRSIFDNLNIQHENAQAEQISKSRLAAICEAVGKTRISDSVELHDCPMLVKVGLRKDGSGTEIKSYKAYSREESKKVSAAEIKASAPVTTKNGTGKKPWEKK